MEFELVSRSECERDARRQVRNGLVLYALDAVGPIGSSRRTGAIRPMMSFFRQAYLCGQMAGRSGLRLACLNGVCNGR
jgi:hypothetical protein